MPLFIFFSATLKFPDNLPRYQKNAFTIFQQIISRIDELIMELNHRKIQATSLFTSIQQVETEMRKEQQTAEQHNRDKALSNLRKARFMKQMQNLTKTLKEQTILTHSYPMPKPTNATELTKKIMDDSPHEILIPDITKDLQEELTKLGLNITPLTNTNSPSNNGTLENTPQCKLSIPSSSTLTMQESTTIVSTEKPTCEHKDVDHSKPTDQDEKTKELTSQNTSQQQQQAQQFTPTYKNEDNEKVGNINTKNATRKTTNEPPRNHQTPKLQKQPPLKKSSASSSVLHPLKLNRNDHIEAYPWAHEASKNFHKTTPLAGKEEVEFLNVSYRTLPQKITTAQKEQMRQPIALTDAALRRIDEHIGMKTKNKNCIFFCKVCDDTTPHEFKRKTKCRRHVRTHLGYSVYRCSFCNFISNNLTSIHLHYISTHGIPKKWIDSNEIKN